MCYSTKNKDYDFNASYILPDYKIATDYWNAQIP